jgi:hypothetical protein
MFKRYRELEGCSEEKLAEELGCTREVIYWMSLCRRPEGEAFTEHVFTIAKRFSVEPLRLMAVLRRVEVMDALAPRPESGAAADEDSLLLAARDHSNDDETNS